MAKGMVRLGLRLSKEQKTSFERAVELGNYHSLTHFLLCAASEKAEEIMKRHSNWLASENDRRVFGDALLNPPAPNEELKAAMKKHCEFTSIN